MFTSRITYLLLFLSCFISSSAGCEGNGEVDQAMTKIRIINKSQHAYTNVSLFSMPFGDLEPLDTTSYHKLKFDPLRDDTMIYCVNDGRNMGRYVEIPEKQVKLASYVIDSISDGIIYVDYIVEEMN